LIFSNTIQSVYNLQASQTSSIRPNMAENSSETREKVRAMVRELLQSVPTEPDTPAASEPTPKHVVVNSLKDKLDRDFDRDESSKSRRTQSSHPWRQIS
jgi:hypothetical protein